jgi:Uma2 family endonuclease
MSVTASGFPEMTVQEYLSDEPRSSVKRDYLAGAVYPRADASDNHCIIAVNLVAQLQAQLRGKQCEAFGSGMRVRLHHFDSTSFYYPDAMIACDPADTGYSWRERPAALFEIIAEETRRVDEHEKRFHYLQLSSLQAYVRIEQSRPERVIDRRTANGWTSESLKGLDAVLRLPELGLEFPFVELFERVTFEG